MESIASIASGAFSILMVFGSGYYIRYMWRKGRLDRQPYTPGKE